VLLIFETPKILGKADVMTMMACRRNNKMEKRKRNRDYARKFQSKVIHANSLMFQESNMEARFTSWLNIRPSVCFV
jgi:hypothetical protein